MSRKNHGGVVEAAGVEPAPPQKANWLMTRDFSSELSGNSLPCCQFVVLWSALLFSGVLPSLGEIVETVGLHAGPTLSRPADCRRSEPESPELALTDW
jgi:hypothetical protein